MTDRDSRGRLWLSIVLLLLFSLGVAAQKKKKPISTALEAKWSQTSFVLEVTTVQLSYNSVIIMKSFIRQQNILMVRVLTYFGPLLATSVISVTSHHGQTERSTTQ